MGLRSGSAAGKPALAALLPAAGSVPRRHGALRRPSSLRASPPPSFFSADLPLGLPGFWRALRYRIHGGWGALPGPAAARPPLGAASGGGGGTRAPRFTPLTHFINVQLKKRRRFHSGVSERESWLGTHRVYSVSPFPPCGAVRCRPCFPAPPSVRVLPSHAAAECLILPDPRQSQVRRFYRVCFHKLWMCVFFSPQCLCNSLIESAF